MSSLHAELAEPQELVDRLLDHVSVDVIIRPGSGMSIADDWWEARVDALGVAVAGMGVNAALDELATTVCAETRRRADEGMLETQMPLLIRLAVAELRDQLRDLLDANARLDHPGIEPEPDGAIAAVHG